ncbi:LysE/ArgO family amino acid transporter [Sporolactobacillus kofuensis]|uniref:LysE/ArgO family amino acid transporter n=1 Tax=Sporolactobacillus kofuensis TaxID=269672 RepID=A0ABW1WGC3_9BACL|nr:LysE/ArgO family amino acid transporter [Sporolactobacillus kofuensis]MCO7176546.1 LysE/ArgO family amino acid transporter [Sporolactobacillus kofuensis]
MLTAWIHGFLLSFSLILPLGAQNVFIFSQGARSSRVSGAVPAVLAASLSDTLLIILAISGVSLLVLTFPWLMTLMFVIGILFLTYIGWTIWSDSSTQKNDAGMLLSSKQQVRFALSVSLLNPHAILDTVGVIGTNALQYSGAEKWIFASACISVSWIWFFSLAYVGYLTGRVSTGNRYIFWVNKLSALMIWGIALYLVWRLIFSSLLR